MNVADCVAAIVNSWEYMHSVARNIYTSNKFHFLALCCACGQSIGWHQKTPRTFNHVPNQLHQEFPIMFQISWMNHPRNSCQNKKNFQSCSKSVGWITPSCQKHQKYFQSRFKSQLDESPKNFLPRTLWLCKNHGKWQHSKNSHFCQRKIWKSKKSHALALNCDS